MAIEPLPYAAKRHAWHVYIVGLVGTLVDDEAIDAVGQLTIGHILQIAWIVGIGLSASAWSRHRLGSGNVLSVDVGHRGRFLIIGIIDAHIGLAVGAYWHPGGSDPHGTHRHLGRGLEVHTVAHVGSSALMALCVASQHAVVFFGYLAQQGVVIGYQLAYGGAPVEEEGIALCRRTYHLACKHGEPGLEVVSSA